ncbi:MAG TPA: LptF/LptG family permease [Spirochaetia bacterium]|nr:LptF/LptG family permease [Spirochaetia bacterium]
MSRSLLGRVMTFLFLFYVLSFGIFYLASALRFTSDIVLPSLRWSYALAGAFVLFIDYLLPVHAAAIAVAASLASGRESGRHPGEDTRPFNKLVGSSLVVFLLLTVAYTLVFEITYPAARRRLVDLQNVTSLARELRTQSEAAERSGDYRTSLGLVNRYLALDPTNREMRDRKSSLESLAAHQEAPPPPRRPAGEQPGAMLDAQALIVKAQKYFDQGDWFSAHYYAQQASVLDPRRSDAMLLAAQASEKMTEAATPGRGKDAESTALFQQKKAAYLLLSEGDYIQAYYSLQRLAAQYPQDKDIRNNLDRAGGAVKGVSFFLDEAQRIEPLPGVDHILFLNSAGADGMEAVSIGRMVQAREGTYFLDVEAVRYDAAGRVAWHFTAPYGKMQGGTILMRCIDRSTQGVQSVPVYSQGARPPQEAAILRVQATEDEMRFLSTRQDALADAGPVELWRMRNSLGSFGLSRGALSVELIMKLVMPFAFLILSLLALPFGWAFRARSVNGPSGLAVLFVPLVPLVLSVLTLLFIYAHRVILGFVVLAFGFTAAVLVGAALQFLLLVSALIVLAGQSGS